MKIPTLALLTALAGAILACWLAVEAAADPLDPYVDDYAPAICETLDEYPSTDGVLGVAIAILHKSGLKPEDAGTVLGRAVVEHCPRHTKLLLDTANRLQARFTKV